MLHAVMEGEGDNHIFFGMTSQGKKENNKQPTTKSSDFLH